MCKLCFLIPGIRASGPWEAGVLGVLQHPQKNFHEPPKGLKFWRKGSNIDVRTGAALFFLLIRGW